MSIFDKQIGALDSSDLAALLSENAVENIRLEFKREVPGKDETLKKLSSFANTYGGHLVVGAEASSTDGRLTGLPGVPAEAGFRQRIIQWLYEGTSPPVVAFVSDGIASPEAADQFCYVISIPQSQQAPHFLNARKGAYVRTDEFSQRFEARHATFDEISQLSQRRALARDTMERLFARAQQRYEVLARRDHASKTKSTAGLGATVELFLCPSFPSAPLVEETQVLKILKDCRVQWRSVGFPNSYDVLSQHESGVILQPAGGFSMLEAGTWGHLFYANEMQRLVDDTPGIHSHSFVAHLLVFLAHARSVMASTGFDGMVETRLVLKRVRDLPWVYFSSGFAEFGPASPLDDDVVVNFSFASTQLVQDLDGVAATLFKGAAFALNWAEVATKPDLVTSFIKRGYEYNMWREAPPIQRIT